jgi:hypothetical protein
MTQTKQLITSRSPHTTGVRYMPFRYSLVFVISQIITTAVESTIIIPGYHTLVLHAYLIRLSYLVIVFYPQPASRQK